MPGTPSSLPDRIGELPSAAAPTLLPSGETARDLGWRVVAATIALTLAGAAAPAALTGLAAANLLPGPPLLAGMLAIALMLAPAAVCLVAALTGLRGIRVRVSRAGGEAELAVLRVLVDTLVFGYALAIAATGIAPGGETRLCTPAAALALVVAWLVLAWVIWRPARPSLRRHGVLALDALLLSAFLHLGGVSVAGWYPLYLLLVLYAGLRFGLVALAVSAGASIAGFAAVILTTASWQLQPALAGGLLAALAVLPACLAGMLRALAAARAKAAGAEVERQTALRLIVETLGAPPATAQAGRGGSPALGDILDFAALEAGTFAVPVESFEPRSLLKRTLVPLQEKAAERGITLHWRVDPRLPRRLRGHAQAFVRIAVVLAEQGLDSASGGPVRLLVDTGAMDADQVRLILHLDGVGPGRDAATATDAGALSLRLVERLAAMAGGTVEQGGDRRARLSVTLPLTVEEDASGRGLDLGRRPVLIATADADLARELSELLAQWNAEPGWSSDVEAALAEHARRAAGERPVLIIDGRARLLSALSLVHRAATLGASTPFVVLIAEERQIAGLGEMAEASLDALIPAPVTEELLANALDALPLPPGRIAAAAEDLTQLGALGPVMDDAVSAAAGRVTPIAAHPRFAPDAAAAVDAHVIEGLRELGDGAGFLGELIETFRADARQIVQRIGAAAAAADVDGFARGIAALQRAASPLGGAPLCELLATMHDLTSGELRQRGTAYLQRLEAEIDRLVAALQEFLPTGEARQG